MRSSSMSVLVALAVLFSAGPLTAQMREGVPLPGQRFASFGYETGDLKLAPYSLSVYTLRVGIGGLMLDRDMLEVGLKHGDATEVPTDGRAQGASANYSINLMDDGGRNIGAFIASLGGEYDTWSMGDVSGNRISLPLRFAFGLQIPPNGEAVAVTPHVGFGAAWYTESGEAIRNGGIHEVSGSGFAGLGEVGLALQAGRFVVSGLLMHQFTLEQRIRFAFSTVF